MVFDSEEPGSLFDRREPRSRAVAVEEDDAGRDFIDVFELPRALVGGRSRRPRMEPRNLNLADSTAEVRLGAAMTLVRREGAAAAQVQNPLDFLLADQVAITARPNKGSQ